MAKTENKMVKLTTKPKGKDAKPATKEFSIEQANKMLKFPKSAWKLDDPNFKWNGEEIAPK